MGVCVCVCVCVRVRMCVWGRLLRNNPLTPRAGVTPKVGWRVRGGMEGIWGGKVGRDHAVSVSITVVLSLWWGFWGML